VRIVFLDRDTLSPQTRLRAPGFDHELVCHGRTSAAEVANRIADADIVLVNKVRLDAHAIAAAPRLKFIAVAATGTDKVDLAACRERGIVVSNIRNYAVHTVPEHTFALIFALRRSICAYRDARLGQNWPHPTRRPATCSKCGSQRDLTPATDAAAATVPYPACGWPGASPGITGSAGIRIHISR